VRSPDLCSPGAVWRPERLEVAGRRVTPGAECFPDCAKAYPGYFP